VGGSSTPTRPKKEERKKREITLNSLKWTPIHNFGTNVSIASIATHKVEKILKLPHPSKIDENTLISI
jgi:hypothetical protein